MKRGFQSHIISLIYLLILMVPGIRTQAEEPVVHAVLFYSPSCGHCYQVITQDLPPLIEKFGDQLLILGVNTHTEGGQALYQIAIDHFQLPPERLGVPMLIVEEIVLVGAYEIPTQFPGIIENGLSRGGIDWPAIPGLLELIEQVNVPQTGQNSTPQVAEEPTPEQQASDVQANFGDPAQASENEASIPEQSRADIEALTESSQDTPPDFATRLDGPSLAIERMSMIERFLLDKTGNTISVITLLGMIASLLWIGMIVLTTDSPSINWSKWVVPLLLLIGLIVAAYMSVVKILHVDALCGPVGDCNTVQQSPYARLFGLLPVGVIGMFGYLAILVAWLIEYYGPALWRKPASFAVWGMALLGTIFSIYLTFLEPFVIGATCAWCLTSAIVMTLLLWATTAQMMQFLKAGRVSRN